MYQIIILLLFLVGLQSCVTRQRCESRFGVCGAIETSVEIQTRDTTIFIKGKTVRDTLKLESTCTEYFTKVVPDTSGRVQLRYYRDKLNQLIIECSAKDGTLTVPKTIVREIKGKTKTVTVEVVPFIYWVGFWAVSFLFLCACVLCVLVFLKII